MQPSELGLLVLFDALEPVGQGVGDLLSADVILVRLIPLELLRLDRAFELVRVLGRLRLPLPRDLELLLLGVLTGVQLLVGELACTCAGE